MSISSLQRNNLTVLPETLDLAARILTGNPSVTNVKPIEVEMTPWGATLVLDFDIFLDNGVTHCRRVTPLLPLQNATGNEFSEMIEDEVKYAQYKADKTNLPLVLT